MMDAFMQLIVGNLEKVGVGVAMFLSVYLANMGLGAWKNVALDYDKFDFHKTLDSVVKFIVLGLSITMLSCAVSVIPAYCGYIGFEIDSATINTIDSVVIIGSFLTATIKYAVDAVMKLKEILGLGNKE